MKKLSPKEALEEIKTEVWAVESVVKESEENPDLWGNKQILDALISRTKGILDRVE